MKKLNQKMAAKTREQNLNYKRVESTGRVQRSRLQFPLNWLMGPLSLHLNLIIHNDIVSCRQITHLQGFTIV